MHSRIFSISKDKEDRDFCLPEYFVPTYADYTVLLDEDRREDSIDWFCKCLDNSLVAYERDGDQIIFHNVKPYLMNMYDAFKQELSKLSDMSFDQFCGEYITLYRLKECTNDECGFWFMMENEYERTMQSFMRCVETDVPYYFGSVYDYHF